MIPKKNFNINQTGKPAVPPPEVPERKRLRISKGEDTSAPVVSSSTIVEKVSLGPTPSHSLGKETREKKVRQAPSIDRLVTYHLPDEQMATPKRLPGRRLPDEQMGPPKDTSDIGNFFIKEEEDIGEV